MKHWMCFFIGHKLQDFRNEELECTRCDHQNYFNDRITIRDLFTAYFWRSQFRKCNDCKKYHKILWFNVGDHNDCLPF